MTTFTQLTPWPQSDFVAPRTFPCTTPNEEIAALAKQLHLLLNEPSLEMDYFRHIDHLIRQLASLESAHPDILFDDMPLRELYAAYLMQWAPSQVLLFFEYDQPLKKDFETLCMTDQRKISQRFNEYAFGWNATAASNLKTSIQKPLCPLSALDSYHNKDRLKADILSFDHLPNADYQELLRWMLLYPQQIEDWIGVAKKGLTLRVNCLPPQLIHILATNTPLREACRYLDFSLLKQTLIDAFAKDRFFTQQALLICAGHPAALSKFLKAIAGVSDEKMDPNASLSLLILSMDENNAKQKAVIKAFLFFLETSFGKSQNDLNVLLGKLCSLVVTKKWDLLLRLLDMAKVCDPADMLLFLGQIGTHQNTAFLNRCIELAGSVHGQLICELLKANPAIYSKHIHLFTICGSLKAVPRIVAYYLKHSSSDEIFDILLTPSATKRNHAIKKELLKGNFAFVEFIIDKPESIWDDKPSSIQEAIWHWRSQYERDSALIEFCEHFANAMPDQELGDFLGALLLLDTADKGQMLRVFSSKNFNDCLDSAKRYSTLALSAILKKNKSSNARRPLSDAEIENDFSNFLAESLLLGNGRINKCLIPALRSFLQCAHLADDQTPYEKRIHKVLDWLEKDRLGIGQRISTAKAPVNVNGKAYALAKSMNGNHAPTDRSTQKAILSAIFTNLRQHPDRGSCFCTSLAIFSQSTYEGLARATTEYCELITRGTLTIQKRDRQTSYPLSYTGSRPDPEEGNKLARAREYTLAQIDAKSGAKLLEPTKSLFTYERSFKGAFADKLSSIALGFKHYGYFKPILQEMQYQASTFFKSFYYARQSKGREKGSGSWILKRNETDKKIKNLYEYNLAFIDMTKSAISRLKKKNFTSPQKKAISSILENFQSYLAKEGQGALLQFTLSLRRPDSTPINSRISPWRFCDGGYNKHISNVYYQGEDLPPTFISAYNPEEAFHSLLTFVEALPARLKNRKGKALDQLLQISTHQHDCNINMSCLLNALEGKDPALVVSELKRQASLLRQLEISANAKQSLLSTFTDDMAPYRPLSFKEGIEEDFRGATVGDFLDFCLDMAVRIADDETFTSTLYHTWETSARNTLENHGYKLPDMITALDLNYSEPSHAQSGLGFSPGILSAKILEFKTFTGKYNPIAVRPGCRLCKDAWFFNKIFYRI